MNLNSPNWTLEPCRKVLAKFFHDHGTEWRWMRVKGRREEDGGGTGSDYVAMCADDGMETNSRRMFLAVSRLFWAIISAFWMSWME